MKTSGIIGEVSSPSRRSVVVGGLSALATPNVFVRNAWAAGKSLYFGTYLGAQGEYLKRVVIPKFQSDFDCRIFQTQNVTLAQIALLRSQKANPAYSVMMMDDIGVPIAKNEGLIEKLPRDKIANLANVFAPFIVNDGFGAGFAISTASHWYNSNMANPPLNFADLWDERHRGRYMMITPKQTQSLQLLAVAASLATGKPILEAQYELDKGWGKMAELKPNVQTIYEVVGTAALQVQQGQADIAGPDYSKQVLPYAAKGAPLTQSKPAEGSFAGVNCITLVKGAPEPDLAASLINRILSPEVQKGMSEATYAAPAVKDIDLRSDIAAVVAYPENRMKEVKLHILDWEHINPRRGAIIEKFDQIFGS